MKKTSFFLIGMAGVLLAFGMTGCDDVVSGAKKMAEALTSYTIVLGGVETGATYAAIVYDGSTTVGGGAAQTKNGSASIRLAPNSGYTSFSAKSYRVRITSGTTVKESASVSFAAGSNTQLDWSKMTTASTGTGGGTGTGSVDNMASIELSVEGTHVFPSAVAGYKKPTAKNVSLRNVGKVATGALYFEWQGSDAFVLSATELESIAAGKVSVLKVTPRTGLPAGVYTAAIFIYGKNIELMGFAVSFTVYNADGTPPEYYDDYDYPAEPEPAYPEAYYDIELDVYGGYTFPDVLEGYWEREPLTVTIFNFGNAPTEDLAIELSSPYFTLNRDHIGSIAEGSTDSFTVVPNMGLPAGFYSATVTVIPITGLAAGSYSTTVPVYGGDIARSFEVWFTVEPEPTEEPFYGIDLDVYGTYTFPEAIFGYTPRTPQSITIANTGNQPTGELTLALSDSTAFTLSSTSVSSIAVGGAATFTVTPKTGLAAGTYTTTVTVSDGNGINASFGVSFVVEDPGNNITGWTSLAPALAYLDANTGGNNVDNPVALKLNANLASSTNGWVALANALASRSKYIALDLSACSMSGTEFDLYAGAVAGKNYIVFLVLPNAATSIANSSRDNSNNNNNYRSYNNSYSKLRTVSGTNVIDIGDCAFYGCTALTSASFPKATSIGDHAFIYSSLTEVSFPKATYIGVSAFFGCTSLTTVSFPKVTSIGNSAFIDCTSLTEVSFPEATSIGTFAFSGCTALTSVSAPKATGIGDHAFYDCTSLTSVFFPEVTSIGSYAFYSSGTTPLTITMGATAPTVYTGMFYDVIGLKTVTVKVPSGATEYDGAWQNAFKDGNTYINLVVEYY